MTSLFWIYALLAAVLLIQANDAHYYGWGYGNRISKFCRSMPCRNGGVCRSTGYSFKCHCFTGFTGDRCETNIDDCANDTCLNGGKCTDGMNSFTCECPYPFQGRHCELSCTIEYDFSERGSVIFLDTVFIAELEVTREECNASICTGDCTVFVPTNEPFPNNTFGCILFSEPIIEAFKTPNFNNCIDACTNDERCLAVSNLITFTRFDNFTSFDLDALYCITYSDYVGNISQVLFDDLDIFGAEKVFRCKPTDGTAPFIDQA